MTTRGYARVSTAEQNLALQIDALRSAGCDKRQIYTDRASGLRPAERPGLEAAIGALEPGDTLAIWRLDRLSRELRELLELLERLRAAGVGLLSITEAIDTRTAGGLLVIQVFGAVAQYERAAMADRVREGLAAARRRGQRFGRPPALSPPQVDMIRSSGATARELARVLNVSRETIRAVLTGQSPYLFPPDRPTPCT